MKYIYTFFFFIFSCCTFASMIGKSLFNVELGEPSYEYKSTKGINTYILADTKDRTVLKREYPEYYNLRDFKTKQRFYRVHIPVILTPNFGSLPKTVNISYSFTFESIYRKRENNLKTTVKKIINTPFKWKRVPVSVGVKTEWILTSDWMVESDKEIWDNCKVLVEDSFGKLKIANQASKSDHWSQPLVNLYFPFFIASWSEQKGFEGRWLDETFPEFIYREVSGNEKFKSCSVQVFSSDSDSPSCGTLDTKDLSKLFVDLQKNWKNPYKDKYVYTNLWKNSAWAVKLRKIADPKLKAAVLSRICLEHPNDSDAAELLLKQLSINNDSEKAGRVYVKCKKKWPQWSEYWFEIYLSSVKNEPTRRALLMSSLRDNPKSGFALKKLTLSLIKDKRTGPAKRLANTWESIEPSNIFVYSAQVEIAKLNENEENLRKAYSQAIRFALPTKTNVILNGVGYDSYVKGCNLLEAGKVETALRYFRKTLTVTNSTACYLRIGDAYLKAKLASPAIQSFKKALELSPDNPGALAGIARTYIRHAKSSSAKIYQKRLEKIISPIIKKEITKKNWTNAIALTKYILDVYPDSQVMLQSYIRSLIHLGLYDQASEELYKISDNKQYATRINMIWAELITAIYCDKSVLVLSKNKINWLKLAVEAWEKVSKLSPGITVSYLEQALLELEMGNNYRAYINLKKCYKKNPSPELAVWIADICLQSAFENPDKILPDNSSKTFAAEAMLFYNKANEAADTKFFSPGTGIGLYRSAKIESKSGADYNAYLRKALRLFPASPELRAVQIKAYATAGAIAPALWEPYTNTFESLRSSNHEILKCLEKIYKLRKIGDFEILKKEALNKIFWNNIFYNNINNKIEVQNPAKIYSIGNQAGFRFVLKKHIFIQPAGAYEWFAFRSKYTSGDLKSGRTLWWKKHLLLADAYKKLKLAFSSTQNKTGEIAVCHAAVSRDYGYSFILDESDSASVYNNELRRIYYLPASSRAKLRSQNYYNSPAFRLGQLDINVPATSVLISNILPPCESSGILAYPPEVSRYYFSEAVTENFLPDYLQDFLMLPNKNIEFTCVKVNDFSLPVDTDFKILRTEKSPRQKKSSCEFSDEGLKIHQSPENDSSLWKGTVVIPLMSKNEIPRMDSFFNKSIKGQIRDINIATTKLKSDNPPAFSFVFTPSPAYRSYKNWNDESTTIEIEWKNSSNAVMRLFVKSYQREKGLLYNNPGVKIGEKNIITPVDIEIEINKSKINVWATPVNATNSTKTISTIHKLSEFAWLRGIYFSIQTKACSSPIDYKIKTFYFGEE